MSHKEGSCVTVVYIVHQKNYDSIRVFIYVWLYANTEELINYEVTEACFWKGTNKKSYLDSNKVQHLNKSKQKRELRAVCTGPLYHYLVSECKAINIMSSEV